MNETFDVLHDRKTDRGIEKTQFGGQVLYQVTCVDEDLCKEFTVSSPRFKFGKWFMWTTIFNSFGYFMDMHNQDSRVMSSILCLLIVILLLKLHLKVKEESLLVMASVGVQLTTTFASGRSRTIFYDMSQVKDIVINEGITMHRVLFYLTILLRERKSLDQTSKLVPLFQQSWPSLHCLMDIYNGAQSVLQHSVT